MDFEREELVGCGEDYWITCPKCEHELEIRNICEMPWGEDNEEEFICPQCGKNFVVRPKYKFEGFYTYTSYYDEE